MPATVIFAFIGILLGYASSTNALPFTLLSDFNKVVIKAYGCLREEFAFGYKGVANRSVFVIDHAGIIKHIEILENPGDLPNFDAVNEVLNSLN